MQKNMDMVHGNPYKLIFFFAVPLVLGNIFQQLYVVVDTAIVARGVGMDALAALGCVDWLIWMVVGVAQGFSQGFSIRIAQRYGEKNIDGVKKVIGQSVVLSILVSILFTLISQLGIPLFLAFLKVPEQLQAMSTLYSRIIFMGISAVVFYNLCAGILRAIGDSKTPLKAMMIASITNIVLDIIAVFVLHMGIAGAALATIIAQLFSGFFCFIKISKIKELTITKEDVKYDEVIFKDLIHLGTPIALKNIIIALGGIFITSIVNGFGVSFIAGFTASNKLYSLLEIAALSYGYAVSTFVGQNYGAKQFVRIKEGVKAGIVLALCTSLMIACIGIVFGKDITMFFISTDNIEEAMLAGKVAYMYLVFMSVALPSLYLLFVFQAVLQGVGNTVVVMRSGILELFVRVSLALLVGYSGFEYGIFGAEVSAWIAAAIYLGMTYFKTVHKEITIKATTL